MTDKITFMLDLDGVCCDWVTAALTSLGKKEYIGNWKPGAKGIEELTGLPKSIFWTELEALGSKWWRDLEEYPWFWDLYHTLTKSGEVVFCTSPNLDPSSLKGKVGWIQDRFGKHFRNYIITNKKNYTAGKNRVLVDDNDKQCLKFRESGGQTILFPQLWNETAFNQEAQLNKIAYVNKKIEEILQ